METIVSYQCGYRIKHECCKNSLRYIHYYQLLVRIQVDMELMYHHNAIRQNEICQNITRVVQAGK